MLLTGTITRRGKEKDKWTLIVTFGTKTNPKTGKEIPNQKWITFKGTKKAAEAELNKLIHEYNTGQYREPTKITLGEWLEKWINDYIKNSSKKKLRTQETYESVVRQHLIPKLGKILLQKLKPSDIQAYYNKSKLSGKTLEQHHAILHQALQVAFINEQILKNNPAELVPEKPKGRNGTEMKVWTEEEVKKFLTAAKEEGIRCEAFYSTAIETGMRKGEICGLKWDDIDFINGNVSVCRTLTRPGPIPVFGQPKNGKSRAITISEPLLNLLKKLKTEQKKEKLKLGKAYNDLGLVFAKVTGDPLQMNNMGQREFQRLIDKAKVKKIRFHDIRHTSATLLLEHKMNAKVIQERLGHTDIGITLNLYSHVTPTMQKEAALVMGSLLNAQ